MIINHQALLWLVILASVIFTYVHPDRLGGPLCLLIASTLFGVCMYLTNVNDGKHEALEAQVKALKERVDMIILQKGMGR